jgi:response regulator RpfG family c-di-GMP phosphodiesterase
LENEYFNDNLKLADDVGFNLSNDEEDTMNVKSNHSRETKIFILSLSANSDYLTMKEAIEAGADEFVEKPFSLKTFREKYLLFKSSC